MAGEPHFTLFSLLMPAWLWMGTPLKAALWAANRLATYTGLFYVWKRLRRRRHAWLVILVINVVSLAALGLVFLLLHARSHR